MRCIDVLPGVKTYEEKEGAFVFRDTVYLVMCPCENKEFERLAPVLWKNFNAGRSTLQIVHRDIPFGNALLTADPEAVLGVKTTAEEYEIDGGPAGILLTYGTETGLIHAYGTALQLLEPYRRQTDDFAFPCCHVADRPAQAFRGIHILVMPESDLTFLHRMVRLCGLLKYSHIVFEFFGTFKLESFPALSWPEAFTHAEFQPLVDDAHAFGMQIVPMINHFGHATYSRYRAGKHVVLDQAPEYDELFICGGWTWDIRRPEVFSILRDVRKEMCDFFGPADYFHIGCDEAYAFDPRYAVGDTELDYFNRTAASIAEDLGRKTLMWIDMFMSSKQFPYPYSGHLAATTEQADALLRRLDERIIAVDWEYEINGDKPETVDHLLKTLPPERLILSPWNQRYNISGRYDLAQSRGLRGVLETTWTTLYDDITCVPYAACCAWDGNARYAEREYELIKAYACRLMRKSFPVDNYRDAGSCREELQHKVI